jgi:hypothetical protein
MINRRRFVQSSLAAAVARQFKRQYDPRNLFRLNANILPA